MQTLPAPSFDGPRIAAPTPPPAAVAPKTFTPVGPSAWLPSAPARPWKWIVIHHSASPTGSAAIFDREHRAKGWDELGYDFVIGNGTNSGDGQIEVGPRWTKQKIGAHAKTLDNRFNEYGIGICLVGNFDVQQPTLRQMQSLATLVSYLSRTYHITPDRILGHKDTKPTDCPGRNFNIAAVRRMASPALADAGDSTDPAAIPASGELLSDVGR
jgi:N-acetylmuramoyl-L-alanine amidase